MQLPSEPTVPEPTQVAPAVPQEEPLPQSDEVIDQIAGEVEIRPDQVVKAGQAAVRRARDQRHGARRCPDDLR